MIFAQCGKDFGIIVAYCEGQACLATIVQQSYKDVPCNTIFMRCQPYLL